MCDPTVTISYPLPKQAANEPGLQMLLVTTSNQQALDIIKEGCRLAFNLTQRSPPKPVAMAPRPSFESAPPVSDISQLYLKGKAPGVRAAFGILSSMQQGLKVESVTIPCSSDHTRKEVHAHIKLLQSDPGHAHDLPCASLPCEDGPRRPRNVTTAATTRTTAGAGVAERMCQDMVMLTVRDSSKDITVNLVSLCGNQWRLKSARLLDLSAAA